MLHKQPLDTSALATDGDDNDGDGHDVGKDQVGGGGDAGGVYNDNEADDANADAWVCDNRQAPRYAQSSGVMYIRLLFARVL